MSRAELRSELRFVLQSAGCLKDSGPGCQIVGTSRGLWLLGGPDFATLSAQMGPLKKNPHASGVEVGWERS